MVNLMRILKRYYLHTCCHIVTRIRIASNNAKVIFWIFTSIVYKCLIYYQYPLFDSGRCCRLSCIYPPWRFILESYRIFSEKFLYICKASCSSFAPTIVADPLDRKLTDNLLALLLIAVTPKLPLFLIL